ncbi:uncharacterized protein FN964_007369 isoform 1-T1 [Alca torda]
MRCRHLGKVQLRCRWRGTILGKSGRSARRYSTASVSSHRDLLQKLLDTLMHKLTDAGSLYPNCLLDYAWSEQAVQELKCTSTRGCAQFWEWTNTICYCKYSNIRHLAKSGKIYCKNEHSQSVSLVSRAVPLLAGPV